MEKNVSIAALESALAHLQETNRRLARVLIVALLMMGIMFGFLIYFFTGFEAQVETITIDSHEGTANYIGNDGDINNGNDTGQESNN